MTREKYKTLDGGLRKKLEQQYGYLCKEKGWDDKELITFLALLLTYREVREKSPSAYIRREDLADAFGSKSRGTASKFMATIEEVEGDQPYQNRGRKKPEEAASSPHSPGVLSAFEGVRTALETVSRAVLGRGDQLTI